MLFSTRTPGTGNPCLGLGRGPVSDSRRRLPSPRASFIRARERQQCFDGTPLPGVLSPTSFCPPRGSLSRTCAEPATHASTHPASPCLMRLRLHAHGVISGVDVEGRRRDVPRRV